MSRSGAVYFYNSVCYGADIRFFWEKSRIVTERISATTKITERCDLIEPLRIKPLSGYILTPYTPTPDINEMQTQQHGVRVSDIDYAGS